MSLFRTCLDGHRCENGSSCLQHPLEEGTYFCDCTSASGDFAGLFCEYQAETYCQLEQETSSTWFCVNQGTCVLETSRSAQYKCDCPAEYEGPVSREHTRMIDCEYEEGVCWRHQIVTLIDGFAHFCDCLLPFSLYRSTVNSSKEMSLATGRALNSIPAQHRPQHHEFSATN